MRKKLLRCDNGHMEDNYLTVNEQVHGTSHRCHALMSSLDRRGRKTGRQRLLKFWLFAPVLVV